MNISILYYSLVLSLLILGVYLLRDKIKKPRANHIRFKRNRYKEITDFVKVQLDKKEIDELFIKTGLSITTLQYQLGRYLIFIVLILILAISQINNGHASLEIYVLLVTVFLISSPTMYVMGKKTPFNFLIDFLKQDYRNKKDVELYRAISQLKNLAIAQQGKPLGADFIIEQLSKFTKITKKDFLQLLSLFRIGKEEEACEEFANNIDTKLGAEFAKILLKLDKINPVELKDQLILYQENMKSERLTKKLKENERTSNLMFLPITGLALIVLLNFVIIVIFIDQMNSIINI